MRHDSIHRRLFCFLGLPSETCLFGLRLRQLATGIDDYPPSCAYSKHCVAAFVCGIARLVDFELV